MIVEQRKIVRYDDIGKIEAPDISNFAGILEDISQTGCRVRFPILLDIDMDNDYEVKFTPTRSGQSSFNLIVHPMWIETEDSATQIGFQFLYSPGERQLLQYIERIAQEKSLLDEELNTDSICIA
ncbi:MAG: PilZ domain-containing protein [Spirochaetaceae bacterium]|nr:PilZ domain-containing protein [Spirochaetaceae bacterium]